MARNWEDRERMVAGLGSEGLMGHVLGFLGVIFAIIGIVADAINTPIGLESLSWLVLAAVVLLLSVTFFIGWAVAWYLKTTEAKK